VVFDKIYNIFKLLKLFQNTLSRDLIMKKSLITSLALMLFTCEAFAIGSIAFNETNGKSGISWNASSIQEAQRLALQSCGYGKCKILTDFQKTCAALAVSPDYGWGWSKGSSLSNVQISALDECRRPGNDNCTVVLSKCE
jgi:hypothetical protein